MTYSARLAEASGWLLKNQNAEDGGWGLTPGQASSLVNTAEALYVLRSAKVQSQAIRNGLDYLRENALAQLTDPKRRSLTGGYRTRYAVFSIVGLSLNDEQNSKEVLADCVRYLIQARNDDGGWGELSNNQDSNVFSTFSGVWALQQIGAELSVLEPAYTWLLARALDSGGWALGNKQTPSPAATAYALLALSGSKHAGSTQAEKGQNFLLQCDLARMEEENISGTLWRHCTYAWAIPALLRTGIAPYEPKIAEAIRAINALYIDGHGWSETDSANACTVRAQFWACIALNFAKEAFDPQVHIPRIDAERTQPILAEPNWVKFAIHSRWATILPASAYRFGVFTLLMFALLVGTSFYSILPSIPDYAEFGIAAALAVTAWYLINIRPTLFPGTSRFGGKMLSVLALVFALYGIDSFTVIKQSKAWLHIGVQRYIVNRYL